MSVVRRLLPQDHKYRWVWSAYHANVGRLLLAVVIANFYIGVHMSDHIAADNRKNWCATIFVASDKGLPPLFLEPLVESLSLRISLSLLSS